MYLGYNTNGLAHHSLPAAIELLASMGYQGVAITLDHAALSPFAADFDAQLKRTRDLLARRGLWSVIETGVRYLLDPVHKHEPTLLSAAADGRQRRIEFLCRAVDVATAIGSRCVSLWSGAAPQEISRKQATGRFIEGLTRVLDYADKHAMDIGFEPEPDMHIDTMAAYAELTERIDSPRLKLTLDVGHLHCQGETPIADVIRRWRDRLVNVHIEDMRAGVHEHLMFGEGEMDFPPIIAALAEVGYDGGVYVELSRHSHVGPAAARQAYEFLNPLLAAARL
jgi:sugar phosphate isomerase/epimerase